MAEPGKLIVFEGGDGIGKSFLSGRLASLFEERAVPSKLLSFPGRRVGSLGNLVYSIHHHPADFGVAEMTALSLQALHIAAHLDEIATVILPELTAGRWIVLDRFWWSTWVYGIQAGADRECLELLIAAERKAWGEVRPAALFVVERKSAIRQENTHDKFQELAGLYREIREREERNQPTFTIDNNDTTQSVEHLLKLADDLL